MAKQELRSGDPSKRRRRGALWSGHRACQREARKTPQHCIRIFPNSITVTGYIGCRAMPSTIKERLELLIEIFDITGPLAYSDLAFRLRLSAGV